MTSIERTKYFEHFKGKGFRTGAQQGQLYSWPHLTYSLQPLLKTFVTPIDAFDQSDEET